MLPLFIVILCDIVLHRAMACCPAIQMSLVDGMLDRESSSISVSSPAGPEFANVSSSPVPEQVLSRPEPEDAPPKLPLEGQEGAPRSQSLDDEAHVDRCFTACIHHCLLFDVLGYAMLITTSFAVLHCFVLGKTMLCYTLLLTAASTP